MAALQRRCISAKLRAMADRTDKETTTLLDSDSSHGLPGGSAAIPSTIRESHYFSKWVTFSVSAIVMLQSGLAYSFSVYSDILKARPCSSRVAFSPGQVQVCKATPCPASEDKRDAQERFSLSQTQVAGIGTAVNLGGASDCRPATPACACPMFLPPPATRFNSHAFLQDT